MATRTGKKPSGTKPPSKPRVTRGKGRKTVVGEIRKKLEEKLTKDVEKASLGDYIRLLQLEKELKDSSEPKEIKVTWVDPEEDGGPGE